MMGGVIDKKDRRVERTRQLLRQALLSLVQERGFEGLSVQDIIDRANVGRATFYAHFNNKDDLLLSGFNDLLAELKRRQRQALAAPGGQDEHRFAFSHALFEHTDAHRQVFHAMLGHPSGAAVQRQLHRVVAELVREDVKALLPAQPAALFEALTQFLAGACFGLLLWWLEKKPRMPVEAVDQLFRQLAVPALKAARRA